VKKEEGEQEFQYNSCPLRGHQKATSTSSRILAGVPLNTPRRDMLTVKKLQAMAKLKAAVKDKYFSLTADHWTSLAKENFPNMKMVHPLKRWNISW